MDSGPGFIQGALILTGVCTGSLALAFVFVALCTRDKRMSLRSLRDSPEAVERRRLRKYNQRYFDQLQEAQKACEGNPPSEAKLAEIKDQWFEEKTPLGDVRMRYNASKESFEYYTDSRNIGYRTLDTVARSFCIGMGCPTLCVNYREEFEKAKSAVLEDRAATEAKEAGTGDGDQETPASEETSVFAKFKSYNERASKPLKKRTRIITERANRFSFLGTISDYEKQLEEEGARVTASNPNLSYADFKNKNV